MEVILLLEDFVRHLNCLLVLAIVNGICTIFGAGGREEGFTPKYLA